jgi:hypothetical protein
MARGLGFACDRGLRFRRRERERVREYACIVVMDKLVCAAGTRYFHPL